MDTFCLVISSICLMYFIYKVESGVCFLSSCSYEDNNGCKNKITDLAISQNDCCDSGRYGFFPFTDELGSGCYKCEPCSKYIKIVDVGWSPWSEWTGCSKSCVGGAKKRSRRCDNPPPSSSGKLCHGASEEIEECSKLHCPNIKTIGPIKIDGGWSPWSSWTRCSKLCNGGIKYRSRRCDSPIPSPSGKYCEGEVVDIEECNVHLCRVDGGWSPWSSWTRCSKLCNGGIKYRSRRCNSPIPSPSGKYCEGEVVDIEECNVHPDGVDGSWSTWSEWSDFSATCGHGVETRHRKCDNTSSNHDGLKCSGENTETRSSYLQPCPMDGGWSEWSVWGGCIAKDCKDLTKGGEATRTRMCDNPPPSNGGKMCKGRFFERGFCIDAPDNCPVNGGWSEWSPWSCTDCKGVIRTRTCDNPAPKLGGKICTGTHFQSFTTNHKYFMDNCSQKCRRNTKVTTTKPPRNRNNYGKPVYDDYEEEY